MVLCSLCAVSWIITTSPWASTTPEKLTLAQKESPYPLYYPTRLPRGVQFNDSQEINHDNLAVIFYLTLPDDRRLIFTEQPLPSDFNFREFYRDHLNTETTITTPIGVATYGSLGTGTTVLASVEAGKTWLLIQAPDGVNLSLLKSILSRLKAV